MIREENETLLWVGGYCLLIAVMGVLFRNDTDDLLKAMHTAVAVTAITVLCMYVPAFFNGLRTRPRTRAWFLILGINLTWAGTFIFYSLIAMLYWALFMGPNGGIIAAVTAQNYTLGLVVQGARWVWLTCMLTGGGIHIAAAQRERLGVAKGFGIWAALITIFILIVAGLSALVP